MLMCRVTERWRGPAAMLLLLELMDDVCVDEMGLGKTVTMIGLL